MRLFYSLVPDVSAIPIAENYILFKSETIAVRLQGKSVSLFLHEILPCLNGEASIDEICAKIPGLSVDDLNLHLHNLFVAGVLHRTDEPASSAFPRKFPAFFANFLNSINIETSFATQRLSCFKIGIVGVEAHGMQSLMAFQQSGLRNFKIVDPFPCDENFF